MVVLIADDGMTGEHKPPLSPKVLVHCLLVHIAAECVVKYSPQGLSENKKG